MAFSIKQALGLALTFVAMTSAIPTAQAPPPPPPPPLPGMPPPKAPAMMLKERRQAAIPPPIVMPPLPGIPGLVPAQPAAIIPNIGAKPTPLSSIGAGTSKKRQAVGLAPPPIVLPPLPGLPGLVAPKPAAVVPVLGAAPTPIPGTRPPIF